MTKESGFFRDVYKFKKDGGVVSSRFNPTDKKPVHFCQEVLASFIYKSSRRVNTKNELIIIHDTTLHNCKQLVTLSGETHK